MSDSISSPRSKKVLIFVIVGLVYFLVAGVVFHFLSRADLPLYLSILGGLFWPLVVVLLLVMSGGADV